MENKLLLSPAEAALMLGLGRTKLFELLTEGRLESCHVGRRRLIPREALENFVTQLRAEQVAEAVA